MTRILPFKNHVLQNTTAAGVELVSQCMMSTEIPPYFLTADRDLLKCVQNWWWGSAEAAYHAQKLILYAKGLGTDHENIPIILRMLQEFHGTSHKKQILPKDFTDLINANFQNLSTNDRRLAEQLTRVPSSIQRDRERNAFDRVCGMHYHPTLQGKDRQASLVEYPRGSGRTVPLTYQIMVDVQEARIRSNSEGNFAQIALDCARTGIFPVEISRYDSTWATGPNGDGQNLLGCAILEAAYQYLNQNGERFSVLEPYDTWPTIATQIGATNLSHDQLAPCDGRVVSVQQATSAVPVTQTHPQNVTPPVLRQNQNIVTFYSDGGKQKIDVLPTGERRYFFVNRKNLWEETTLNRHMESLNSRVDIQVGASGAFSQNKLRMNYGGTTGNTQPCNQGAPTASSCPCLIM